MDSPNLEFTDNLEFGDFSSNIAMSIFANQIESESRYQIHDSRFTIQVTTQIGRKYCNKLKSDKELSKIVDRIETAGQVSSTFGLKDVSFQFDTDCRKKKTMEKVKSKRQNLSN